MGFLNGQSWRGGGGMMIKKFGTGMKLEVFNIMETKDCDVTTFT